MPLNEKSLDSALYDEWAQWINIAPMNDLSAQSISDRYHWHLQKGGIFKKEHNLLPRIRKGDLSRAQEPWPIAIYLDHIRSAHNVGSIVRTVEAFSLGQITFSSQTPFATHKQVKDTAMGSLEWVACVQNDDLSLLPRPIIILETSPDALSLYEFIFPSSFTLAVGNEEYGCSEEVLKAADIVIEIPLRGHKNSLNVANAFAIAASEISRQRNLI